MDLCKVNLRMFQILLASFFLLMLIVGCGNEAVRQDESLAKEEEAVDGDNIKGVDIQDPDNDYHENQVVEHGDNEYVDDNNLDNEGSASQEKEEPAVSDIDYNDDPEQQDEVSEEVAEIIDQLNVSYGESVHAAYWLLEQGKEIVPYLDQILGMYDWQEIHGAYPFNVYWALGHIGGVEAEQVLLKHATEDEDAELALKGLRSREHNPNKGIMSFDSEVMSKPRIESEILGFVNRGDTIIILDSFIVNEEEVGPRGGYAVYDYIKVVDTNIDGYVQRIGVDFSICY